MKRWVKILLILVVVAILVVVSGAVWFWNNPIAVLIWSGRRALDGAGLERMEVQVSTGGLAYWSGGSGPDLVLLHGAGDQAGTWSQVAPELMRSYTLHVLDLPGHGASEPTEGPLAVSTILEGVEGFIESLDAETPPIVVGNSLGAWLGTLLAHRRPELVGRVVIVNGGPLRHEPEGLTLTPSTRDEARRLMQALRDPTSIPVPNFVLDDLVERIPDGEIQRMMQEYDDMVAHVLDGRLGEIRTPVDIVWGTSDRLFDLDYARRMDAELRASRLTEIPRCGHVPQVECPPLLVETLLRVLAMDPPVPAAVSDPIGPQGDVPGNDR